ncbi:MAG: carbohydrate ABC transporter permease [bacterium]
MKVYSRVKNSLFKFNFYKFMLSLLRFILLTGIFYIILLPILTKVSSSLMTIEDVLDKTVMWIPRNITFENYRIVWDHMNYPRSFTNSLLLTVVVSIFQLASCTLVGYGFGRFDFKFKNLLFSLVILTLIVPPQVIMIPLYMNFRNFNLFGLLNNPINLLGSYWPFILTALTATGLRNGLYIFILRQFFKGMPHNLEEAAYVDGAGLYQAFFKIMLVGAKPVLVIVFLFSFVWQWNDDIFLTLYLPQGADYLPMALRNIDHVILESMVGYFSSEMAGQYGSIFRNTAALLFISPLLILYAFMQRYFVESIQRTGIVG